MQNRLAHLIQRYNLASVWSQYNPILLNGEIGIESDTGKAKLGDGITPWSSLDYFITMTVQPRYSAGNGLTIDENQLLSHSLRFSYIGEV